jgi:hypothetical protein
VSDCCLTPSEQFFSHMARKSYIVKPDYKIGICCLLRSKSKDWLALDPDNVYPQTDASLSYHYQNSIKLVGVP